jgi:cytochrome bd-type quinol oxidase subunit 1
MRVLGQELSESAFLGLFLYGEKRISKLMH